jgi:tRNA-dihydrouridine synthase
MRKHYSGYLKGLHNGAKLRIHLMQFIEAAPIEEALRAFADRYEDSLPEPRRHESNTQAG